MEVVSIRGFNDTGFSQWGSLERGERVELLSNAVESGSVCQVLDFLRDWYPDVGSQADVASLLADVPDFAPMVPLEGIETVAAYYYHIDGGGIETALRSLAKNVGVTSKSVVIAESGASEWTDGDDAESEIAGASVVSLDWFEGKGRFDKLKAALDEVRPDVLVYHAWFDENLLWDIALCHACGVRVVLNVHGVFSHFLEVTDGRRYSWSDGRLFASVAMAVRLCDAVVGQSQTNRLFFSKFNPRSFAVAHELPWEYRALLDKPRSRQTSAKLLWVGRFDPYKHPQDAVEILAGVRESVPEATLLYVGKSADGVYEREIMARADELGIGDAIEFAGFKGDVTRYYEEADALVLTTEVEGYCLVMAEALAAGLPVVAYDLPYLPFVQCAGVCWVAQGDARAAAAAATLLLEDKLRWERASSAAQAFMHEGIYELMPTTWTDVFSSLLSAPSAEALSIVESEKVMWDTLLAHYLSGEQKTFAQLEERQKAADAAAFERDDVLQSHAYNVGKTLIAPLKLVRAAVSKVG